MVKWKLKGNEWNKESKRKNDSNLMANLNFLLDTVKRRIKTSSTINNVNYMLKNLDHNVETEWRNENNEKGFQIWTDAGKVVLQKKR